MQPERPRQPEPERPRDNVPDLRSIELLSSDLADVRAAISSAYAGSDGNGRGSDGAALSALLTTRDRIAAALDRCEASLNRHRAAMVLRESYRDRLTGALQRDVGLDRLHAEVARCQRSDESLVVVFVDVDHLKLVNDSLGHAAGDAVLAAVGRALRDGLRAYDLVVRYGGDEFVCGFTCTQRRDAEARIVQVRRLLAESAPGVRISVGYAFLSDDDAVETVVQRADRDMYQQRTDDRRRTAYDAHPTNGQVIELAVVDLNGQVPQLRLSDELADVEAAGDEI
jgi:diguanylate cyclase (GGDEF)-like protein